ncbi:fumarylacetoacetate hydrolase family protein [Rhodoplanes roseus]|uniref:Hydrolase n=1 Tax=Rhodoplanes roseus TaxID=29409 RepID=A0A327KZS3_9BRAD|nr:fumarylacetoacetate hydrolase family protein [Rhodoplanes roseus]RAI43686.1 hydrolase [Rhodoplanes roseus]
MRIAAVHAADGKIFGTLSDDEFRPLLMNGAPVRDLRDVIALLEAGPDRLQHGTPVALSSQTLAAPVGPLTKNVVCVGKNYHEHAREFARSGVDQSGDKQESPEFPVVFTKATSSLADPLQPVPASDDPTGTTDYEGELGVVIGKRCSKVSAEEALDFVFGYTVVNDVTARALQQRHKQWFLGKSLDGFCPVGPWLVTADEMGPLDGQMLTTAVNGEPRQSAPLRDMIFDTPTIIATVSAYVTLEPGDLIATGTPAGVGIGFQPQRFLVPGDIVTVAIEGIGELTNPIS